MSNIPTNGQQVGGLEPPADFGGEFAADIAAVFQQHGTKNFDPNVSRADPEVGGTPPGGPVASMGNEPGDAPPGGWPSTPEAGSIPQQRVDVATDPFGTPPATAPQTAPAVDGQPGGGDGSGGSEAPALAPPDPATAASPPAPVAPADGGALPDPTAPAETSTPEPTLAPSDGWVYEYEQAPGVKAHRKFSNDEVEEALLLRDWAQNLPAHVSAAFAQISDGQAVAIPRADYDRFQAWQSQQQRQTRDADLTNLDADPQVIQALQQARDEAEQLRQQIAASQQQQPVAQQYPVLDQNLSGTATDYDRAARDYQERFGLTDAERDQLLDSVVQANIIQGLQERHTQRNPVTGQVIKVDGYGALSKALDAAMTWNPDIHAAALQRKQAAQAAQQQAVNPQQPNTQPSTSPGVAVTQKRANAASLASAPSAAVPPTPRDKPLTGQEAVWAMAEDLMEHMNK